MADDQSQIATWLSSDVAQELNRAFGAMTLLTHEQQKPLSEEVIAILLRRLPDLLRHKSKFVHYQAIPYYAWLRSHFHGYRRQMLEFLESDDVGYQRNALFYYETYCLPGEIEPLLRFRTSAHAGETRMGGPWWYEYRDIALEKIEHVLGRRFQGQQLSEPYLGSSVHWRDWTPFLSWYEKHRAA